MPNVTLYLSDVKTHQFAIDTNNKTITVLYHFDSPFTNRLVKPSNFTYSGLEKTFNHYTRRTPRLAPSNLVVALDVQVANVVLLKVQVCELAGSMDDVGARRRTPATHETDIGEAANPQRTVLDPSSSAARNRRVINYQIIKNFYKM